ncbi:MAG: T9SS type A sorting domain-containing protein [Bacteroidetes bacterium]|nr:MAG: T9SS type A sorting domain-containing protein [Bacteroidota bacterium]
MFEYNSSGNIFIQENSSFDGSVWAVNFRKEYNYNLSGKDSIQLEYSFVNNVWSLSNKRSWTYDSLDKMTRRITEAFSNNVFQVVEDIRTDYSLSPPGYVRVDSIYIGSMGNLVLVNINLYQYSNSDSSKFLVLSSPFVIMFGGVSMWEWYRCGDTLWDRQGLITGWWYDGTFDSNCNPINYNDGTASNSSGVHSNQFDYTYLNCQKMKVLLSAEKSKICEGDSILLAANVFGGTPPYQYQWTSNNGLMNATNSHPTINPDSTTKYFITVTDANLLHWSDSIEVKVDPFIHANVNILSIDTSSNCNSALLVASNTRGAWLVWLFDNSYTSNHDTVFLARFNGSYSIQINSGVCPAQFDTLVLTSLIHPAPIVNVNKGCNQLFAHSATATLYKWYLNSDTNVYFIGDTIDILVNANYFIIAEDSLGCVSDRDFTYFEMFKLIPSFGNACNDSCLGRANVQVLPPYSPYSYQWSNGDTLSFADSLCNSIVSLTVTDRDGCQLTAIDSCLGVSIFEIDNAIKRINVFPNPASTVLHLDLMNTDFNFPIHWQVMDVFGRIIDDDIIHENDIKLNENMYSSGMYIFRITKDSKYKGGGKFIVRKN